MSERVRLPGGLSLRPWEMSDAPAVREAFAEPGMERQADAPVVTVSDAGQWVGRRQEQWSRGAAFAFAVADAEPRPEDRRQFQEVHLLARKD